MQRDCSRRDATRSKLVITVGLPGCGKTSYLAKLGANAISSDEIRRRLADDPTDQSIHKLVFSTIRYLIRQRLAAGRRLTYVDATHLMCWERRPYLQLGRKHGITVEVLYFDVPVEVCLERNKLRPRRVPAAAIREMAHRLEPPTKAEGFARVLTVR